MIKENKMKLNKIMIIMFALFLFGIISVNADTTTGLVASHNPEGTGSWVDLSGNGNDLTCYGGQTGTNFDGLNDYCVSKDDIHVKNGFTMSFKADINLNSNRWNDVIGVLVSSEERLGFAYDVRGSKPYGRNILESKGVRSSLYIYDIENQGLFNVVIDDNSEKIYLNSILIKNTPRTSSVDFRGKLNIGNWQSDPLQIFKGSIDNIAIYNRALSQSDVTELYNNGGLPSVPQPLDTSVVEQTYSQIQDTQVSINDTDWHTLLNGNFTLLNNATNYGEAILNIESSTNDMPISCRTTLDNVTSTEQTETIINNGDIVTVDLLRADIIILAGEHNIKFECKNNILGDTVIKSSIGIGHILQSSSGVDINHEYLELQRTINSGDSFYEIIRLSGTAGEELSENKYVFVDWSSVVTNQHTQAQTIKIKPVIYTGFGPHVCEEVEQYLLPGQIKTLGGFCFVDEQEFSFRVVDISGTGINIDYDTNIHVKEMDYFTTESIKRNVLIDDSISSTSFINKATTTFETGLNNAQVVVKGHLTATSSIDDIIEVYVEVKNSFGEIIHESQEMRLSTIDQLNNMVFQMITPVQSGTNTFNLYIKSVGGNTILIPSLEINGYVTQKLDFVENTFNITAKEFWDESVLSDFSANVGGATYSTTGTTITATGTSTYEDITIIKNEYVPRLYSQWDTSQDLDSFIGKHKLIITSKEKYSNKTINNFKVETEKGIFTAIEGEIIIYPFQNIYNWNVTTDSYFNKTNVEFQVGEQIINKEVNNFTDASLSFQDESLNTIYPTCSWLGNTLNQQTGYDISVQQSIGNNITCNLPGFSTITNNFSLFSVPFLNLFTMNITEININIFDRDNSTLILTPSTVTIIGPTQSTQVVTSTGTVQLKNITFESGEYQILISNNNYTSEIVYFTYDNQRSIQQDVYMIPTSNTDKGVIIIKVVDEQSERLQNVLVKVQEWRSQSNSFITVGQAKTSGDGTAQLNIELGTKIYRFTATLDDVFVSSINQVIYESGRTLTLVLPTDVKSAETYLDHIITNIVVEDVFGTNLSKATFTFEDVNNLVYESCIELYEVNGFIKNKIDEECITSSGGTLFLVFDINKTFSQQLKFTMKIEGQTLIIDDSYYFKGSVDISSILLKYNLHLFIPLLFCLIGLVIGLYTRNVYISIIALIIMTWISNSITPDILTKELSAVITVFLLIGLWGGSRK